MAAIFFGITDKGKHRENNEDTFVVQELSGTPYLLACVIDGVGGYNGGEVAAEIARSVILKKMQHVPGNIIENLQHAVITANEKIQEQRHTSRNHANMACVLTCVVADIKNNKLWYAHVGDTRLYLLRDASLVKISSDHSAVGFLEESGRLSEHDAMQHPRRNEINRALGFETAIAEADDYIETGESPFLPGDIILLCSDGLSDMIGSAAIRTILNQDKPVAAKAKALIDAANAAGGNDNITAVLVENNKQPKKLVALKPADKKTGEERSLPGNKNPGHRPPIKTGNKKALLICLVLFLLCLFVGAFINRNQIKNDTPVAAAPVTKDVKLIQLTAAARDTSKVLSFPAGTNFIMAEPVLISKDSFCINGNGAHIIAGTNYKGHALNISSSARHIVLDSLVFENFDGAILIQKSNIVFKNVRFINCRVPVQYAASFADTTISGRFKDSIFTHSKSLQKQ